jgi:hypothetical protein
MFGRRCISAFFVFSGLGASALSGAPILGYDIQLTAFQTGLFLSHDQQISAADWGSGRYYRLDTNSPGGVITGSFPATTNMLIGAIDSGDPTRGVATVAATPDPFKARVAAIARTSSDADRARARAGLSVGDLIRIDGPGTEVEATFEMTWTMDIGGLVRSRIPGAELGIFGDFGAPVDIAVLDYEFAMFLNSTVLQSAPYTPLTYFFGGYYYSEVVVGEMVQAGGGDNWDWVYADSVIDDVQYGEGELSFERGPKMPWFIDSTRDIQVTYRHTVLIPTGVDLNLVTRWGGSARCASPSCFIQYRSLNSAGVGIVLPEGYSVFSTLGATYPSLGDGPGSGGTGPGSEVPEPQTSVLAGAGLLALALLSRRGGVKRRG